MTLLPVISGKEVARVLNQVGFQIVRQKGSHCQLRHTDGRRTTVPIHANQDMPRGTLKAILRDINIDTDEFIELLNQ